MFKDKEILLKLCEDIQKETHTFFEEQQERKNKEDLYNVFFAKIENIELTAADKEFVKKEIKKYVENLELKTFVEQKEYEIVKTNTEEDVCMIIGMTVKSWMKHLATKIEEVVKMKKK